MESSSSTLQLLWVAKCSKLTALILGTCLAIYITAIGTGSYDQLSGNVLLATQKLETAQDSSSAPSPESPLVVVLLSSTQRSGSSMLGELLATMDNSYYWFEPFKRINHTDCYNSRECSGSYGLLSGNVLLATQKLETAQDSSSAPSPESPLVVVLLSSTQRSGSSMLGELLATMDNSYYWFEPFRRIHHTDCYNNRECSGEYLSVISKCILVGKHDYNKCRSTTSRVMKLIRGSLADVSAVLTLQDLNVKMIHLTRDPRGSLNSIPHDWGSGGDNPTIRCKEINQDMEAYERLQLIYPGRVMNISYERFCTDTTGKTKEIYQFLYGDSDIPNSTLKYLQSHMSGQSNGYFNTVRNTESHINEWRNQIKDNFLHDIEEEPYCQAIIKKMGYKLFGSINIVRNMSVSVFL